MIFVMMLSVLTPAVSAAQNASTDYSKEEIVSMSLETNYSGFEFNVDKAISLGMSKEDALEAEKSFDELNSHIQAEKESPQIEPRSKASIAIKQAVDYMKKNKEKIEDGIKAGIDKIPFIKQKVKEKWKEAVSIVAITEAMSHYVGFAESVEAAIAGAITDTTPIPESAANIIAKTVTFLLPI
ncbi:hypothetical protein [Salibacterium halotolerans]|uniref:Uncharacterized protein n=1 Tax=Salibacterium halotolerans TaxID=1884432 RepID=A0A1I5SET8_9BACI|nr:hypothetical protein [Salibacterium halotolerans]SFP69264.1 hypothetical protein SAMN05518683_108155 [Salibacterium halotolerans]